MVEQALERRETDQQGSTESVTAVAVVNGDLVCTMVNDTFCALLERPRKRRHRPADHGVHRLVWVGRQPVSLWERPGWCCDHAGNRANRTAPLAALCWWGAFTDGSAHLHADRNDAYPHLPARSVALPTRRRSTAASWPGATKSPAAGRPPTGWRKLLYMSISNRPLGEMLDYVYEQAQHLLSVIGMTVMWAPGFALSDEHTRSGGNLVLRLALGFCANRCSMRLCWPNSMSSRRQFSCPRL